MSLLTVYIYTCGHTIIKIYNCTQNYFVTEISQSGIFDDWRHWSKIYKCINVRAIVFKKSMLVSKKNSERQKVIVKCNLKTPFKNSWDQQ